MNSKHKILRSCSVRCRSLDVRLYFNNLIIVLLILKLFHNANSDLYNVTMFIPMIYVMITVDDNKILDNNIEQ